MVFYWKQMFFRNVFYWEFVAKIIFITCWLLMIDEITILNTNCMFILFENRSYYVLSNHKIYYYVILQKSSWIIIDVLFLQSKKQYLSETMICIKMLYHIGKFYIVVISTGIRNRSFIIYFGNWDGQGIMCSAIYYYYHTPQLCAWRG